MRQCADWFTTLIRSKRALPLQATRLAAFVVVRLDPGGVRHERMPHERVRKALEHVPVARQRHDDHPRAGVSGRQVLRLALKVLRVLGLRTYDGPILQVLWRVPRGDWGASGGVRSAARGTVPM